MKIRTGFVSNSSSSSFIIGYDVGDELNTSEKVIKNWMCEKLKLNDESDPIKKIVVRCIDKTIEQLKENSYPDEGVLKDWNEIEFFKNFSLNSEHTYFVKELFNSYDKIAVIDFPRYGPLSCFESLIDDLGEDYDETVKSKNKNYRIYRF